VIRVATSRSKEWFGKELSPEAIRERYTPMLRTWPDGTLSLKVKVDTAPGKTTVASAKLEDGNVVVKGEADTFDLVKGAELSVMARLGGV
jgi:hypothetical protein